MRCEVRHEFAVAAEMCIRDRVNVEVAGNTEKVTLLGTYFSKQLRFGKETFVTGVRTTDPWWKVQGSWPDDASGDVLLGRDLAAKLGRGPGDRLEIAGSARRVVGAVSYTHLDVYKRQCSARTCP